MDVRNEAELAALRRILEISRGTSSFTVVACNSPALRESLFARLRTEDIAFGEAVIVLGSVDPVHEARLQIPTGTVEAVFIIGLDYLLAESSADSDRLLAVLNRSRERWRSAFPNQPLVFWLTPHTSVRLTTHAPDLRAWISHELEFEDAVGTGIRPDQLSLSRNYTWLFNLDAAAKRARLVDLEKRLSLNLPEPALLQEWARAWEEKIWLLSFVGEKQLAEQTGRRVLAVLDDSDASHEFWKAEITDALVGLLMSRREFEEALMLLRRTAIPIYHKLGDHRSEAIIKGKIARILSLQGNWDKAERLLREEVLPILQKQGDPTDVAGAWDGVADVYIARGQFDDALRILRDEVLPPLERLGDQSAVAVTLSGVAHVLRRTGRLEEAMRLCRNQLLPIFVRTGNLEAQSQCRSEIVEILLAMGQVDEAIRVLRDEELPTHERLGIPHKATRCRARLAFALKRRGRPEDTSEAFRLLTECHRTAREKDWPEAQQYEILLLSWGVPQEWLKAT